MNRRTRNSGSVHLRNSRPAALQSRGPIFPADRMDHGLPVRNGPVGVLKDRSEHGRSTFRPFGSIALVQRFGHGVHLVKTLFAGFVQIVPFSLVYFFQRAKDALQQNFRTVI